MTDSASGSLGPIFSSGFKVIEVLEVFRTSSVCVLLGDLIRKYFALLGSNGDFLKVRFEDVTGIACM